MPNPYFSASTPNSSTYHIDLNLLDLEAEDDGPDETENKARVAIHDVLSSNTLKANLKRNVYNTQCTQSISCTVFTFEWFDGEW